MSYILKLIIVSSLFVASCKNVEKKEQISLTTPEGMIWVDSKSYTKGAKNNDPYAMMREKPSHALYFKKLLN